MRRILIAVTGLSPQIVTETLFALAVHRRPAWMPDEIHLLTTRKGADTARLMLLARGQSDAGWFHHLRQEWDLPDIAFDESHIHVIHGPDGEALEDIRSDLENSHVADSIADFVRRMTANQATEIHASIAGGRKSMGFLLGYAMSLFGRSQDRLSHVLVSPPFENNPQFFYPSKAPRVIQHRAADGRSEPLDCSTAQVSLNEIPFVRLRQGLPNRLLEGQASFGEVVAAANRAQSDEASLVLDRRTLGVTVDAESLELTDMEFVVCYWLALRARQGLPAVDWGTQQARAEFIRYAKRCLGAASVRVENAEQATEAWLDNPLRMARYFEPYKSRINKKLTALLGGGARRYSIERLIGADGVRCYRLPLQASQIKILD